MVAGIKPPAPPVIGPARNHGSRDNAPYDHVVIHSTVSPCEPGGARDIARMFATTTRLASAHYCVDPEEEIQSLGDSYIAYAAPPNQHKLHVEMCEFPGPLPNDSPGSARWKALKKSWRWVRPKQQKMLDRTARLTAQLCAAYDIPPWYVDINGMKAGRRGVTTHHNISQAFHETTHWDPGWWPRYRFMRLVRKYFTEMTGIKPARGKLTGKQVRKR